MSLIASLLKKYSIENDSKFGLCIPTGNSYSIPNFNIFQQTFVLLFLSSSATWNLSENFSNIKDQTLWQIMPDNCEKKYPKSTFWSFLIKDRIKHFFDNIVLDNNMTHLLKKNSKNVYSRRSKTFSKTSNWFMVKRHSSDIKVHTSDIRVI